MNCGLEMLFLDAYLGLGDDCNGPLIPCSPCSDTFCIKWKVRCNSPGTGGCQTCIKWTIKHSNGAGIDGHSFSQGTLMCGQTLSDCYCWEPSWGPGGLTTGTYEIDMSVLQGDCLSGTVKGFSSNTFAYDSVTDSWTKLT